MTLEAATYINQLNSSYPEGGADRSTADDHLRLIKATVLATFPAVTGPVTVTHAELNLVAGATKTLASVSALTVKYSLSISAATADIARISQTVSVLWAKVTSISALNTQYSLSISQVKASISALTTSLNSVSVVMQAAVASVSAVLNTDLHSVSAVLQTSINAVSNTVSVMAVRINTLSVSVAAVQTDVARISVTVSAIWTRINTLSVSVSLLTTYLPTLGTAQASTSGTSIDFGSIPAWAKKITVMLAGVSTNGTSNIIIQIGDSGGIETSDYAGATSTPDVGGISTSNYTNGFNLNSAAVANAAGDAYHGALVLTLVNAATYTWAASGIFGNSATASTSIVAGSKSLSAALDRLTITTANGTDAFDAGTINILYE